MNLSRTIRLLLWAGTVVSLLVVGVVLLFAPPQVALMGLVGDDAGYYSNIARNLCLGYGCTFDRLHATGGFNPLFLALLTGVYWLMPGPPDVMILHRAGLLLDYGLALAGLGAYVALMHRFVAMQLPQSSARPYLVPAAALLYALFIGWKGLYGVDAHLTLLLLFLYGLGVLRGGLLKDRLPAALLDGLLLGLLVLARVDSLFLLVPIYVVAALSAGKGARFRNVALQGAATVTLVAPYLVWNRVQFQHWMPISARLKTGFPQVDVGQSLQTLLHSSLNHADQFFLATVMGTGLLILVLVGRQLVGEGRAALRPPANALMTALAGYGVLRGFWMVLFSRFDVQASTLIASSSISVMASLWLLSRSRVGRRYPGRTVGATAMVLVVASLLLFAGKLHAVSDRWQAWTQPDSTDQLALAIAIGNETPADAVLFGGGLGLMGFYSDRTWINADGVVNDDTYQAAFTEPDGLDRYLTANGVTHVVFSDMETRDLGRDGFVVVVPGHLTGAEQTYRVAPGDLLQWTQVAERGNHVVYLARYTP